MDKNSDLMRYILIKREKEMNNNYELSPEQQSIYDKFEMACKADETIRKQIEALLIANNMVETMKIAKGEPIMPFSQNNSSEKKEENITTEQNVASFLYSSDGSDVQGGTTNSVQNENNKQLIYKKAGYIDALIMALLTGFMGGLSLDILLFLIIK